MVIPCFNPYKCIISNTIPNPEFISYPRAQIQPVTSF